MLTRRHPRPIVLLTFLFLFGLYIARTAFALDIRSDYPGELNNPHDLWIFLPIGYFFSIAIEAPVLVLGLSKSLSFKQRLFAGIWLTACTYPIVVLVLPILFQNSSRSLYLTVAETFAPVAECTLFWIAFHKYLPRKATVIARNLGVVILANLLSFGAGEFLNANHWFGLFNF